MEAVVPAGLVYYYTSLILILFWVWVKLSDEDGFHIQIHFHETSGYGKILLFTIVSW